MNWQLKELLISIFNCHQLLPFVEFFDGDILQLHLCSIKFHLIVTGLDNTNSTVVIV